MNLSTRSYEAELLDQPDLPFEAIRRNMQELDFINRWLGGHHITLQGVQALLAQQTPAATPVTICEIGCGGGDNLAAIARWAQQRQLAIRCIGIDIKSSCIAVASRHPLLQHNTSWIVSDYRDASFTTPPDIIFCSLFCHHFTEAALVAQLQWMRNHSRTGFFINDLHRHPLAYTSIKWLTRLFSRSYLVKNDAPLSVARGFTAGEWKQLLAQAGFTRYRLQWKWAFRHLLTFTHA